VAQYNTLLLKLKFLLSDKIKFNSPNPLLVYFNSRVKRNEQAKQLKVLNELIAAFWSKFQYKYGFLRPDVIDQIARQVQRDLEKESLDPNKFESITLKKLVLLTIHQECQRCLKLHLYSQHPVPSQIEAINDLLLFSLEGITHEKIKL